MSSFRVSQKVTFSEYFVLEKQKQKRRHYIDHALKKSNLTNGLVTSVCCSNFFPWIMKFNISHMYRVADQLFFPLKYLLCNTVIM